MIVKTLIIFSLLVLIPGAGQSKLMMRCIGMLRVRPDGTKQSVVLYSDGTLDSAYISEKDIHYTDGHLIMEKPDREKVFELAGKIYASANSSDTEGFNYDELLKSLHERGKVILFIEAEDGKAKDGKAKQFMRDYDKGFNSAGMKQLDRFLQELFEK